jgi:hypothetical protein
MPEIKYTDANPGPCCQKIEDMIDYAGNLMKRWPPFYRYSLGEEIEKEMLLMLRLATKARLRYMNKSTLQGLDTSKEVLKAFVRSANRTVFTDRNGEERRLLSNHSFDVWSGYIEEIGKLIGGWINAVSGRTNRGDPSK